MDDSIWNALCKQPKLKAFSEKYAKLVYDSTIQLHQSLQPILSALNLRAIGLTKCANFESALRDAKVLQQLAPFSALGYIREAGIYSEQGQQLQVIDICDKAMTMVGTMDTQYDALKRAKTDAEQRQNTRVDFISQLPVDIVMTTLIPMITNGCLSNSSKSIPCLYVSNVWRDSIIKCFDGLHFEIGDDDSADLSKVVAIAPHIVTLEVNRYSKGTWLGDLLRNNDFSSLEELTIEGCSANCADYLVSSLKPIGSTLTHLQIAHNRATTISIEDILVNSPNLVSLEVTQSCAANISSLPMTTWPKLTTLTLPSDDIFTCDEAMAIGKRFPSLQSLEFASCEDMEATRVILDYYPWMNDLDFYEYGSRLGIRFNAYGRRHKDIGVTRFSLEMTHMASAALESVLYILRQHRNTLESISYRMDPTNVYEGIYNIEYSRLRRLYLHDSGWWILHNAPMLEELDIYCSLPDPESPVFDTLPLPPKLKKLGLTLPCTVTRVGSRPLTRYLDLYAHHSHVKELAIVFYSSKNIDDVLDAILPLGQLECLRIECTGDWDSTQMQRFFDGLPKRCQNLSTLMISYKNTPSTSSMNALKRLEHLDEFGFSIKDMDDDDGFWHAIQSFSQLKCIHISSANAKNMYRLQRLEEQRPDLKLIIQRLLRPC